MRDPTRLHEALDALLGAEPVAVAPADRAIQAIRAHLRANPQEEHDLAALAQDHGLSPSALRRHWQRLYGVPPWRFVIESRLRRAARQLVETTQTVGRIARANGFGDQLYFARCFRRFTGQSPTVYRRRYR